MAASLRSDKITVLIHYNRLSLFYTLAPLLLTRDVARQLDFTQSLNFCLTKDRNRRLMIVRFFEGYGRLGDCVDAGLMGRLREKYDRFVFFDDGDGAGCTRLEVLPFVDLYLKKQLFRDRGIYGRLLYGRQLFTDYYHREFHVEDAHPYYRLPMENQTDADKLRVAWNLGVGSYPILARSQRWGVASARMAGARLGFLPYRNPHRIQHKNDNTYDVHARFSVADQRPTISFQRKMLLEKVVNNPRFMTGRVDPRQYNKEIQHSKITLSPFGSGEICFRDFEAVQNESLLLKPNMDHLETWPDLFRPYQTYVPIEWDGSDIETVTESYLENLSRRRELTSAANDVYHEALAQMADRARLLVDWIHGE